MMNRVMKDSGVEWVGQIPEEWKIYKIAQVFKQHKLKNEGLVEQNLLSLSYGNVVRRDLNSNEGLLPKNFEGYNIIEENDIVLRMTDLQNDQKSLRVGLNKERGIITSAYITIRSSSAVNSRYGYYYLHAFDLSKGFYGMGAGVRQGVNFNELKKLDFIYPSLGEQQKIASFLDEKVSHINNIIEDTKKSIENLKAYKQSLITETVTKGLDPNVEMKNSGIEWIGKIPKRWGIEKLKFHSILDPSHRENDNLPEKAQFVPMDNIKDGYLMLSEVRYTDDLVGKYTYFQDGDIVIAKVRPSFENGNIAIASNLENNIGFGTTEIFTLRVVSNKVITEFLFYYLRNSNFLNVASSTMTGVAGLKRISSSFLMNYKIGIPDIEEQSRIIRYLDEKIDKIDSLLRQKEQIVTELESYKKSLIYEYVTGKKEVK